MFSDQEFSKKYFLTMHLPEILYQNCQAALAAASINGLNCCAGGDISIAKNLPRSEMVSICYEIFKCYHD